MTFPKTPEQLSADWLTDCLQADGVLTTGRVASFVVEPFLEGFGILGRLVRLVLSYEGAPTDAPVSVVAKFPAEAESNLALAHGMQFYERECNFYRHAAADTSFLVPRVHYLEIDDAHRFVLLMEDLGRVTMCDQVDGGTAEQVHKIAPALARHHAKFWDRTADFDWAVRFDDPTLAGVVEHVYHASMAATLDAFSDVISPEMREVIELLDGKIGGLWSKLSEAHPTLIHGDFRMDNIGFDVDGTVVAFDWQISGINTGVYDLGFMMSQSVNPDVREPIEQQVLRTYHQTLCENGVTGYSFDACLADYRRTVLVCLIYPVITCGTLDVSNERGKAMGTLSLHRSLSAIKTLSAHEMHL